MLCGRRRCCTSTGSPALDIRPSFLPALPFPHQFGPRESPSVDQNTVAHHAVWLVLTQHLQREPCSEQQAKFFCLPYRPPISWALGNPPLLIKIGWLIMLCGLCRRCTSTGRQASNIGQSFLPALPSPQSWALWNHPLSIRFGWSIMLYSGRRRCTSTGSPAQNNSLSF